MHQARFVPTEKDLRETEARLALGAMGSLLPLFKKFGNGGQAANGTRFHRRFDRRADLFRYKTRQSERRSLLNSRYS